MQTMLNKLREYARRKSHTVNTQKSEVKSYTSNLPPLFYDGAQLPYTDYFLYLGMVFDIHINLNTAADAALRPFTAGTTASDSSYGNMTLQTGYTSACGSLVRVQSLLVCMQAKFRPPHSYDMAKNWTILCKMADDSVQEDFDGQGHNPFMVCHERVWSRASTVQLVPGGSTSIQCFKPKAIAPLREKSYMLTCN